MVQVNLPTLLFLGVFGSTTSFAKPLSILIDPGHGGRDRGAVHAGVAEADLVLQIGLKLETYIKEDSHFLVNLTRRGDHFVGLDTRSALARNSKADLVLSLHVNSSPEPKAKGAEFYFQNQLPPDEEALFLAAKENQASEIVGPPQLRSDHLSPAAPPNREVQVILEDLVHNQNIRKSAELARRLYLGWQGPRKAPGYSLRQAPFRVISTSGAPAVLVEIGYLTNTEDASELTQAEASQQIAQGLYRSLVNYREFIDTRPHAF